MMAAMVVFRCVKCRTEVSYPVREVPLPGPEEAKAPYEVENADQCPPRMAPGTFALDPEPHGEPYVVVPDPERPGTGSLRVSAGPRGSVVLSPSDIRGLRRTGDRSRLNGCCGPDGMDGLNLVCAFCRAEVATESSDCWTWQQVRLDPRAVEPVDLPPVGGTR